MRSLTSSDSCRKLASMALLNPPELRPSLLVLMVAYLAQRRGQRDDAGHLVATLAPASLSKDGKHQSDVRVNLTAAIEIGLVVKTDDQVRLNDGVSTVAREGPTSVVSLLRSRVLDERVNTAPWGSQAGARDLTNGLAWFLSFPPTSAPARMEGASPTAKELQEADFGPRQPSNRHSADPDDDGGGWPISNETRWNAFRRWACSLGFAWVTPKGRLVPDPTPAIRESLPAMFGEGTELTASEFVAKLGVALPVLESGRCRQLVEENWRRPAPDHMRLSVPTSEALERLRSERLIVFDDRDDSQRMSRADGRTFSHVARVVPR